MALQRLTRSLASRPVLPTSALAFQRSLFSSSSILAKVPTIGDVTPETTANYKEKVQAYREKQQAALHAPTEASSVTPTDENASAPRRVVNSILYGSEKGKREEELMEQSYGKLLARGKYVHEIVQHHVKPEHGEEYAELIEKEFPRIAQDKENGVHLVGSWRTCIGDADTFVHIWEYQGCKASCSSNRSSC